MRRALVLFILIGLAFSTRSAAAATLDSELQRRLASPSSGDSVDVILVLADRADLREFRGRRAEGATVIARLQSHSRRSQPAVLAFLKARGYEGRTRAFWIANAIAVRVAVNLLPALARLPGLERVEYDQPVGFGDIETGGASTEWNLEITGVDAVWKAYGFDGTGIVVGSMDTGFDPNHPALLGKWRGGTNSWVDIVNGLTNPYDDHGHGTHTIGTMVGGDGPGPFSPDIGIAYNAKFISAKILDATNSFSSSSTVIAGAQWMLDPDSNPVTDDFPQVINNSWLFFSQTTTVFHDAVAAWRAVGIIPVFALGNNGPNSSTTNPPGNYDNTIGVGATDSNDLIASFSSRGPSPLGDGFPADQRKPDLSAPGALVLSSLPGGGYSQWSGTSMASPHVAGTVALMLQAHPGGEMSYDEVRSTLISTGVDLGTAGYDFNYGYCRLDALAAVTSALNPGIHLNASTSGHDVELIWNSGADVVRYDIYRSGTQQDNAAPVIGSTTDTTFTDPNRFGRTYYKIRAIRDMGISPFTNEVTLDVCAPTAATCTIVNAATSVLRTADFNGDGNLDVAMTFNVTTGSVKLAPGNGAGQFGPISTIPAGTRTDGLAIGDFNGDGIRDLVVTNNVTTGTISILLGNGAGGQGNGTFAAPVAYPAGSRPTALTCADFDQDGITDLAVTSNGTNEILVLRGNGTGGTGDGTFATAVGYAVGTLPRGMTVGDFNHDGVADLASANNGNSTVSVLLGHLTGGRADGTFDPAATYVCGSGAHRIVTADFNADGILDLAVTRNATPGFVAILIGQGSGGVGNGTFAAVVSFAAGSTPQGIATADLNGDGITDLCVGNGTATASVSVLLGTGTGGAGNGGFESPLRLAAGVNPVDVVVADVDGNAAPDLLMANATGGQNLCVLPGSCTSEAGTGLAVVAPNGGESWPAGATQTVMWSKDPGVISVDIELSRDQGTTWETIATDRTGTSFDWMVTSPSASGTARIRVSDARVGSTDASDAGFTIAPDVRLGVEPPARDALELAIENPSLDRLTVRFRLRALPVARLEVLDVSGRRVVSRAVGHLGAGAHVLDLGRDLRAGLYLVRLSQGDDRITRKAAVVR